MATEDQVPEKQKRKKGGRRKRRGKKKKKQRQRRGKEWPSARDGRARILLKIAREQTTCRCNLFMLSLGSALLACSVSWLRLAIFKAPVSCSHPRSQGHRDAVSHSLGAKVTTNSYASYHCLRLILSAYVRIHVHCP